MPRGGDMGVFIPLEDGALTALIDASGHGLAAYQVAQTARNTILNSSSYEPLVLMTELDYALRGGIGAAVAIARVYYDRIEYSGVGNVRTSVDLKPLISDPGVVGLRMRKPKKVTIGFAQNSWLLMHTDGIKRPSSILNGTAESATKLLIETCASDLDDAGVLLTRWRSEV